MAESNEATLSAQVGEIKSTLLAKIAERDEQIKTFGAANENTGKRIDELGATLVTATAELTAVKAAQAATDEEIKNERCRIDQLDAKSKRSGGQYATAVDSKTIAAMVVEHDHYKSYQASGGRSSEKIPLKSLYAPRESKLFGLTSVTGDLVPPFRADMVMAQTRPLLIRDLMPVRPLSTPSVTYLEETAFYSVLGTAAITSITRSSQTATVTTTAAHGLLSGDLVRVSGAAQAEYNIDAYVTVTSPTVFTYTVADSPASGSGTMLFVKLNGTGAAGMVAEGDLKPEADFQAVERRAEAQVIAHWMKITKQAAEDAPQVVAYIEDRLLYGLAFKEEVAILYGSGVGANLQGIMTHPRVQTYNWSDGTVGDTKIDAFRRAMSRAHIREFIPTAGVLHPLDKEDIDLAKGSDDHYLWTSAPGGAGGTQLWAVPLVVTNAMAHGDFLVGAFGSGGAALWDREDANVQIATQNEDDFIRNKRLLLAEERLALTIGRPDAFVAGNFDNTPAA